MDNIKETLDSHISFMYMHSNSSGQSILTSKSSADDARDDIEDFSSGSLEWNGGPTEKHDQYINKDKSRLRKPINLHFMHNIGRALKKPWRKARKNSDKVPLISRHGMIDRDVTYAMREIRDDSAAISQPSMLIP